MLARHNWNAPLPETLLLIYSAKKRAEVAPGVGSGTDLFMIGPGLGSFTILSDEVVSYLDGVFREIIRKEERALIKGREDLRKFIDHRVQAQAAQQAVTGPETTA
jgi:hypothetical protein